MSTIDQLATQATWTGSDLLPVYNSANGDARKGSISSLLTYFKQTFTSPDYTTTLTVATEGLTIALPDDSTNQWALLSPAGSLTAVTLTLPAVANAICGQEITVTSTQTITTLSINANGATSVFRAAASIDQETGFTLRFHKSTTSWYKVI